tara:strand:- start:962 stop:1237 length:276 start_codon:yes stop_codon:yes gene_type:complete
MTKIIRLTASSQTTFEYFIKVPDHVTVEDLEKVDKGHDIFDGGYYTSTDQWGGDWEHEDIEEIKEDDLPQDTEIDDLKSYTAKDLDIKEKN